MDNNSNQLLGWEAVADVFSSNTIDNNPLVTGNLREEQGEISDEEIARLQRQHKAPSVKDVFGDDAVKTSEKEEKEIEEPVVEDPTEEPAKDDKVVDTKEKEDSVVDTPTEGEELDNEGIQVTAFFDAVAEEMGLEVEEGEDKPTTVEELCEYFRDMIEENSTPEYASEEVAQLDEFVRNGGKLEDYFKAAPAIDYETFDTTIEENQKRIVRELLAAKGFNEKQIARKIEKYEDAGILEDEAEDALEAMRDVAEERKEQLLAQQKKENEQRVERQQRFVDDVVTNIKSLKDIRGIAIPEKDKKALLNYIFKADADGLTQYQKDYSKSVKNLIESAYFTMKGDTLLDTAKKIGTSSAIKTLKQSLKNTGSSKNSKKVHTSSPNSIWSIAARSLNNI